MFERRRKTKVVVRGAQRMNSHDSHVSAHVLLTLIWYLLLVVKL